MAKKLKTMAIVAALMVILVAVFQLPWPSIYSRIVRMNPYPTQEYFQIIGLLSPNSLSAITIVIGLVIIAWVGLASR